MNHKKKSLLELGQEYENHVKLQDAFIKRCTEDIKRAEKMGDRDAVRELKSNLYKFYEIKRELNDTALQLKNYYNRDNFES